VKQKVFCVGLPKTGTSSLTMALKELGYTVRHWPDINRVVDTAEKMDALTDGTVISHMEVLDRLWPDARFILTVRDEEEWIKSCRWHYTEHIHLKDLSPVQKWSRRVVWGVEDYDEQIFRSVSRAHTPHVLEYFKNRPDKLLIMNICAGDGYEKLCPFLGLPVLNKRFPYRNRGKVTLKANSKIAVFTSIIPHDYVTLKPPIYINTEVDYWVISDEQFGLFPWDDFLVTRTSKSPLREIQDYRVLLHKWFPEYDYVIWVDGEVCLKVDPVYLVEMLKTSGTGIMFIEHPWRDCIYEEAQVYKGFKAVDYDTIDAQTDHYRAEGYPEHNGLITVNFFIKDNKDPDVSRLMERWHKETENGCCRTQVSFNYSSWAEKVPYATVPWDVLGTGSHVDLWQNNSIYQRKGYQR